MYNAHMCIYGRVQGVGFRISSQQKALELGVYGWARNLSNGSVELEVEGESRKVDQFIEFIESAMSFPIKVERIEVTPRGNLKGYTSFQIK